MSSADLIGSYDHKRRTLMSKDYREMWSSLDMNLEAHDGLLGVLSDAYKNIYLSQKNRPEGMKYFDFVISEVHGLRIEEIVEAKKEKQEGHRHVLCVCSGRADPGG